MRASRTAFAAALIGGIMSCGDDGTGSQPAVALRFVNPPAELVAGQLFDLTVELIDAANARSQETGRRVSVTMSNGDQLSGPVAVTSVGGLARFSDLAITDAGTAFRILATSGEIMATTAPFTVRVAPASAARSSFSPDSIVFISGVPTSIEFSFADVYGNPIAAQPVSITSSLTGTIVSPASGTTSENGTFTTTFTATTSGTATLAATVGGTVLTLGGHLAATEFCASLQLNVPGTVTGTLPIATCDVVGRPAAVYRFTKAGAGGVAFTAMPSGFTARVEVKTSLTEPSVAIQPTTTIPGAEWLLPDGSYLYRISALSPAAAGSYSITSSSISGASGVTTRFIVAPGTYTGQVLSLTDRQFGDGTLYDYFVLFSNRSCTITMRSTVFDAFIWIDDPVDIVNVDGDDNGGGGTDARVVMSPCSHNGNPIGVLANSNVGPNGSTPTGPYTLTIEYGPALPALRTQPSRPAAVRPDTAHRDLSELIRIKRSAAVRK